MRSRGRTGRASRLLLAATMVALGCAAASNVRLIGSGASFPYPIYSTWFKTFSRQTAGVIVDYQAKGSGAGIRDFINETVDFAGSDAAMTDAEIAEVDAGVLLVPITAGKIVVAYNLPGMDEPLRVPRDAYPAIFLGEITNWRDPQIAAANPGIDLPDLDITVVRRADSSGTTFAFTKHLAEISSAWRDGPGIGKTVLWPDSDKFIAAPKNDGVTATIKQTPGAIGYIEYAYARFADVPMAALENRAGEFVAPGLRSGRAALAGTPLPDDFRVWIPDPADPAAYPIVTYSWLLVKRRYEDKAKAAALADMLVYCLTDGQQVAARMGYIPLPGHVVEQSLDAVAELR